MHVHETRIITLWKVLTFAAVVEIGTGIGLLLAPTLVVGLLLGGGVSEMGLLLARALGITLLALALACWPRRQNPETGSGALRGMLVYNALITLLLVFAAAVLHVAGPLLWPTVVLHGAVALLLIWKRQDIGASIM
jgi:hypothetical protein